MHRLLGPDGDRPVLVVSGEPGIGKSRTVDELLVTQDDAIVRRAACHLADQVLPFGPFLELAARHTELVGLAEVLTEAAGDDGSGERAELQRRRSFDRIVTALLDPEDRTIVVIEDVHWADDVSLFAIAHLARRVSGTDHRIVLTHRPDERTAAYAGVLADLARQRIVEEVELRRLDADQVASMAEAMDGKVLTGSQREVLVELSDGNPFHVEELIRSGVELDSDDVVVPRPVEHHVVARLAQLDPTTRDAACRAAVIGRDVPVAHLAELMGWDPTETARQATAMVEAGLLKDVDGDRLRFVHELARRAVETQLLAMERVEIHQRIVDHLTEQAAVRGGVVDDRARVDLARHAYAANDWQAAIEHGTSAARAALARWSAPAAVSHLDHVVDAGGRAGIDLATEVFLLRSRARTHIGDPDGARDDLLTAVRLADADGDAAAAWETRFELAMLDGQQSHDAARAGLDDALAAAERWGDRVAIARTICRQANLATNRFDFDGAAALLDRAAELAAESGDDRIVAEANLLAMVNHSIRGDLQPARRHGAAAVERFRRLDDPVGLANALFSLSMTGGDHYGDVARPSAPLARCAAEADEALQIATTLGWTAGRAFAMRGLAGVRSAEGRAAEAVALMRASIELAEESGHITQVMRGHAVMGEVLIDVAAYSRARPHVERTIEIAHQVGAAAPALPSLIRLVEVDVAEGRLDVAEGRLAELLEGGPHVVRGVVGARAEWLLARERFADALDVVERAMVEQPDGPEGEPPVRLALLAAVALTELDRLDEAADLLDGGDRQARRNGMRMMLRHVVAQRATVCARLGDRDAALRHCDEAWRLTEEAADGLDDELATILRDDTRRRTRAVPRGEPTPVGNGAVLTKREREVAEVVARGLTNQQIADELFISVRTAETHVKRILAKLGVTSRGQIAHWVHQQSAN